jgi:hypothetical protein
MADRTQLRVQVDAERADAEELAELTGQLRRALLELDVDAAEPAPGGPAPPGAKAAEALALGALVVSLVNASGVLASVVEAVQSWAVGRGPRTVKLELDGDVLELSGISSRRQDQLIQTWLDRHAGG